MTTAQKLAVDAPPPSTSEILVRMLVDLGVQEAFGIVGGAIAPFCDVLGRAGRPRVLAMRHEAGATFAAAEASLAADRPVLVFTTTGPGLTNTLTGAIAARSEGAKLVVICGATSSAHRGRGAVQETGDLGLRIDDLAGAFDLAVTIESGRELASVAARLATGFASPQGYVALLALPLARQRAPCPEPVRIPAVRRRHVVRAPASTIAEVVEALREPFAIWVGFGARRAADRVRALAERCQARVLTTPRAKGVFPEAHPLAAGVTGFGGHASVDDVLVREAPARLLVLGSRLGEFSSIWDPKLVPKHGFVHVDVDAGAFGVAYPHAPTLPVLSDIGAFLDDLLALLSPPAPHARSTPPRAASPVLAARGGSPTASREGPLPAREGPLPANREGPMPAAREGPVRPQALMEALQRVVVDGSDALVMAEPGNSFAWTNHHLRFATPRYRMSGFWASMGHMVTGAVGASIATGRKTVVVTGDGSMLMLSEVSSAAAYTAPVVWVVLNDARYGITEAGMSAQGFTPVETRFPRCDFVALARAVGADGVGVTRESELDAALQAALHAKGPFVVDVVIDPAERAPFLRRIQALAAMGANREEGP